MFALACLDQANMILPSVKPVDWKKYYLKPLMEKLQEIEPLASLNPTNQLTSLLQDWTTNRQNARTLEDVLNKLPYTWELDKTKTGNLLKQLDFFIEETRRELKGGTPRLIKIKAMKKISASVSQTPYQEEHF
jgi:lipid II:glycine glycyltransferase (peptidoglycan interpeptide bridge formation enzyme)